jgi:hypothetical protein
LAPEIDFSFVIDQTPPPHSFVSLLSDPDHRRAPWSRTLMRTTWVTSPSSSHRVRSPLHRRTSGARISHPRRRRRSRGRSAGRVLRGRSGGGRNFACLCSCRHHTDTLSTRIACFVGCIEDDDEEPCPDSQDWPGSFVTDARMYEEREAKLRARELNSSKLNKSASRVIV